MQVVFVAIASQTIVGIETKIADSVVCSTGIRCIVPVLVAFGLLLGDSRQGASDSSEHG